MGESKEERRARYLRDLELERARRAARYREHASEERAHSKAYYERNKARVKARGHAKRVAGRGQNFTAEEWEELCYHAGQRCVCCGQEKPLTADHIVPVVKGGDNSIRNIQPLCNDCNRLKSVRVADFETERKVGLLTSV